MQLKPRTLHDLAEMVTGGSGGFMLDGGDRAGIGGSFPYRSSSSLTDFFRSCDTDYVHQGDSRVPWTEGILAELNKGSCARHDLPADLIVRVIQELMDPVDFRRSKSLDLDKAFAVLNETLSREKLEAYRDGAGQCHLRSASGTSAVVDIRARAFSQKDRERRAKWETYLDTSSEDDFTLKVLVPLFQSLGYQRISVAGHKDKLLEFGKDLWMKLRLPTSHFIYFGIQVKTGKLDSAGKTKPGNENITEALNQIRMALQDPVTDTEVNRDVLIDHVYLIASGEITKTARQLLLEQLNREQRRQLIFMDRSELLDLLVLTNMELPP
jgi:hypothetical protein